MYEIIHYQTPDGRDIFAEWLKGLKDGQAKYAITRRINRIEQGNFGDHKYCRLGVSELKIDVGAGYRVYYSITNNQIILLLCGGDKKGQDADVKRACTYLQEWKDGN